MKRKDHQKFAAALASTFSVYGVECTENLLSAWWTALEPFALAGVEAALAYHISNHEGFGHRAPTPADCIRYLDVTLIEIRHKRASSIIADATTRAEPYREKIRLAQAEVNLGNLSNVDAGLRIGLAQNEVDKIMSEPAVIAARAPFSFREDPHVLKLPDPIERAVAIIGRPQ